MPRSLASGLLLLLGLLPVSAAAQTSADEAAVFDRLSTREQILEAQRSRSESLTRQRSLFAYRLARQRELGFTPHPETRLEDARAFDLALVALRRASEETRTLARELDRVRGERTAVEAAFVTRATSRKTAEDGALDSPRPFAFGQLVRPVRGVIVALPGSRRDSSTRVELRYDGMKILARLNDPVRAIAAGTISRVEAMPQGGFAVVTAHHAGLVSIITGLRDITVSPGDKVVTGQTIGLTGRNLDGAAVISVELWRDRRPQDAKALLRMRRLSREK